MRRGEGDPECKLRVVNRVSDEPQREQGEVLQRPRHGKRADIHGAQAEAGDERRDMCFCLRVAAKPPVPMRVMVLMCLLLDDDQITCLKQVNNRLIHLQQASDAMIES